MGSNFGNARAICLRNDFSRLDFKDELNSATHCLRCVLRKFTIFELENSDWSTRVSFSTIMYVYVIRMYVIRMCEIRMCEIRMYVIRMECDTYVCCVYECDTYVCELSSAFHFF